MLSCLLKVALQICYDSMDDRKALMARIGVAHLACVLRHPPSALNWLW